jgi:hypothetical protein
VSLRTIGIRAKPAAFTFAVFDTSEGRIVNVETISIPQALYRPDALRYVRTTVLDLLREYGTTQGCIRETEPAAQAPSTARLQIEAVVQESFASSNLTKYFVGQISSISARVGIPRTDFKPLVSGEKVFDRVENWDEFSAEEREAILSAIGAANA